MRPRPGKSGAKKVSYTEKAKKKSNRKKPTKTRTT